jgi:hypothetical protein
MGNEAVQSERINFIKTSPAPFLIEDIPARNPFPGEKKQTRKPQIGAVSGQEFSPLDDSCG